MNTSLQGSCHCGAVRFRCELNLSTPTSRCNCSICSKTRLWKSPPLPASAFELTHGSDALGEYRFGSKRVAHMFCRHCGIKLFGHGDKASFPEAFYVVNIATLDGLSDEQRAALPVIFQDGRHDDWDAQPSHAAIL